MTAKGFLTDTIDVDANISFCAWSLPVALVQELVVVRQTEPSRLGRVDRHFEPDGKGLLRGQ
jgi:hypothetical protein